MTLRLCRRLGGLLAALGTVGCSMEPAYLAPAQEMPSAYTNTLAAAETPGASSQWWRAYGSEELTALVDEALAQNQDLRAAVHRITQASALADSSAASLLPTIRGSASDIWDFPFSGRGTDRPILQTGRTREIGLDASYEVDLWGRNRSAMSAALANVEASRFDRETVVMTLTADVALTYLQYLQSLDRIAVARRNVENMRKVLATVSQRAQIGEGTELEVAQQRDALAQAESVVPTFRLQAERQRTRLALLVGRPPQFLEIRATSMMELAVPAVHPGMPSELLLQRPDIRRAEAGLRSANANIGVARARLLPTFSLTTEAGYSSPALASLLEPGTLFYGAVGRLVQTIFDGGKTASDIAANEARYAELTEAYRKAVVSALRDVEDALAAARLMADKEEAQKVALERAREASRLARASFEIGTANFLNVLESDRSVNRSEDEMVLTRYARLEASVTLFRSLGGGTLVDQAHNEKERADAPAVVIR